MGTVALESGCATQTTQASPTQSAARILPPPSLEETLIKTTKEGFDPEEGNLYLRTEEYRTRAGVLQKSVTVGERSLNNAVVARYTETALYDKNDNEVEVLRKWDRSTEWGSFAYDSVKYYRRDEKGNVLQKKSLTDKTGDGIYDLIEIMLFDATGNEVKLLDGHLDANGIISHGEIATYLPDEGDRIHTDRLKDGKLVESFKGGAGAQEPAHNPTDIIYDKTVWLTSPLNIVPSEY